MITNISPLSRELLARNRPVTIGLAGAGQMGTDLLVQVARMPGLRIGAVAEVNRPRAFSAAKLAGHGDGEVIEASSPAAVDRAIEGGKLAITEDPQAVATAGRIDVVIDATG